MARTRSGSYDAAGNETDHWEMGVSAYDADALRPDRVYDQLGQVVCETEPGNSADTEYIYDQAGNITQQTNPDGSSLIEHLRR